MSWGLAGALVASLCYGVATVFQAMGARRVERTDGVDPRLLMRVLGSLPFLLGTAMDACGLVFNLYALRKLPLFEVQGIVNTNLAVTAVAAGLVLHIRLTRKDKLAVVSVVFGLILLGLAAGPEGDGTFTSTGRWVLLGVSLALAATALVLGNVYKNAHPAVLGTVAGFLFGVFGIAVRILPSLDPVRLAYGPGRLRRTDRLDHGLPVLHHRPPTRFRQRHGSRLGRRRDGGPGADRPDPARRQRPPRLRRRRRRRLPPRRRRRTRPGQVRRDPVRRR